MDRVERTTREQFGVPMPDVAVPEGASWRPESQEMTMRSGQTYHRCLIEERAGDYPRRHGTLRALASDSLIDRVLERR